MRKGMKKNRRGEGIKNSVGKVGSPVLSRMVRVDFTADAWIDTNEDKEQTMQLSGGSEFQAGRMVSIRVFTEKKYLEKTK